MNEIEPQYERMDLRGGSDSGLHAQIASVLVILLAIYGGYRASVPPRCAVEVRYSRGGEGGGRIHSVETVTYEEADESGGRCEDALVEEV
jgi:hypothetical protein